MKRLLLPLVLLFGSCSLFTTPDPAPALLVLQDMNADYSEVLNNFTILSNSLDIPAESKQELLDKLATMGQKRAQQVDLLEQYLKSLGDVDFNTWGEEFLKRYLDLKLKTKE